MQKKYLFKINTPIGIVVRTTQDYWNLIQLKHPEVIGKLALIKNKWERFLVSTKSGKDHFLRKAQKVIKK